MKRIRLPIRESWLAREKVRFFLSPDTKLNSPNPARPGARTNVATKFSSTATSHKPAPINIAPDSPRPTRDNRGGLDRPSFSPMYSLTLPADRRSEEHTSELQSQSNLVCRLLLEKKKKPS